MKRKSKDLLAIYRQLDDASSESLLAFAEFLLTRCQTGQAAVLPTVPAHVEPPADESVIGAIKRLRRTYSMLDTGTLFNETTVLMSSHVMGGRAADEVIAELEVLFDKYYQLYKAIPDAGK
ncbi:MAG: hypothetical protein KDJ38_16010 [Gammaproteobacteria bacterium]|nr:hypothetical protein [Gammaproteobacteria bacterium]